MWAKFMATIFAFLVKPGRIGTDDVLKVRDDLF